MLVCAAIAPHGFSIIEEISGVENKLFKPTRDAMRTLGKMIMSEKPETIIILSPHGLRLKGNNAIYLTEYCRGSLSQFGKSVNLSYKCDTALALEILNKTKEYDIPTVGCNYGALSGELSNIEMDWGTLIPLWFCQSDYQPKIVVITPTREIELDKLVKFGEVIAETANKSKKRVALIASADQGHCHDVNGPYGYHEESRKYDNIISSIIESNDLNKLLDIDMDLVNNAKPDSLWQMLILYGALNVVPMNGILLSYQVPTYFGMTVASYNTQKPLKDFS